MYSLEKIQQVGGGKSLNIREIISDLICETQVDTSKTNGARFSPVQESVTEFFKNKVVNSLYHMYSKGEYHESSTEDSYIGQKIKVDDLLVPPSNIKTL